MGLDEQIVLMLAEPRWPKIAPCEDNGSYDNTTDDVVDIQAEGQ